MILEKPVSGKVYTNCQTRPCLDTTVGSRFITAKLQEALDMGKSCTINKGLFTDQLLGDLRYYLSIFQQQSRQYSQSLPGEHWSCWPMTRSSALPMLRVTLRARVHPS